MWRTECGCRNMHGTTQHVPQWSLGWFGTFLAQGRGSTRMPRVTAHPPGTLPCLPLLSIQPTQTVHLEATITTRDSRQDKPKRTATVQEQIVITGNFTRTGRACQENSSISSVLWSLLAPLPLHQFLGPMPRNLQN